MFQDAGNVKDGKEADKDEKPADTQMSGVEDEQASKTTMKAAKKGDTDDEEPFDNVMDALEAAGPEKLPEDIDIGDLTPPPSPVFANQRVPRMQKGKQHFRFSMGEAIMSQNDVLLNVCNYLGLKEFFNLYCVSKRFYVLINSHYSTHIKQLALNYAPLSSTIFPYQLYKRACIQDPVLRTRATNPSDPNAHTPETTRTVPGLKWVLMCAYREAIVHDILLCLALEGHRFPACVQGAVLRLWALMDQPYNGQRLAATRDPDLWSHRDIFLALMFCIKLDLRFSDPLLGNGECLLRRLFLGQKSLVVLWEALRGLNARTRLEVMTMVIEWDGRVPSGPDGQPREVEEGETMLGVPVEKVGSLGREGWKQGADFLLRPDQLLLREAVRRGMNIHRCFLDFVLWGYVDWTWLRPIPLPDLAALNLTTRQKRGENTEAQRAEESQHWHFRQHR